VSYWNRNTDYEPTDSYGVEIEPGDLVVSGGHIGIVSKINSYNAPTIRYPREVNIEAWEWGAPDVEEEYEVYDWTLYYEMRRKGEEYKPEIKKRMAKDKRVVGKRDGFSTQNRQTTYNITVIRKHDGTEPSSLVEVIDRHKELFPSKENNDG